MSEADREQRRVDAYFATDAEFWRDVYDQPDVFAQIHRERRERALEWIEGLGLEAASRVLEVGCGAGLLAVELAERGYVVEATDTVPVMRELTERRAAERGVAVRVADADVHRLPYADESYDVAVALGVVPWVADPRLAVHELARVVRRGGYVVVNADNRRRLVNFLDPALTPALERARNAARRILRRPRWDGARAAQHSPAELDAMLADAGLEKQASLGLGFGPVTFLRRELLPADSSVALHGRLQRLADRNAPILRSAAAQYLVLARRA